MASPSIAVDIACVGFGPAMGGFLTTLSRALADAPGADWLESRAAPGQPLQVVCFERADDLAAGVSGVATRARAIRSSFPGLDPAAIPLASRIAEEHLVYLLDPIGASRRPPALAALDRLLRLPGAARLVRHHALEFPVVPAFLRKHGGFVLSIGQFLQWVGAHLMASGAVQLWPASPVAAAIIEHGQVAGVRLLDQGTTRDGRPAAGYTPGLEVQAALTVVGDGPVGAVGRQLDEAFGLPPGNARREWAVGMKVVVDLPRAPRGSGLRPGTVIHTFGYPEPEIFGFLYVHDAETASLGIFVPSWFDSPVRTAYRYLQHWMLHPYLWRHLDGGRLRSWGAKSVQESGRRGEPWLAGDGYARIGEGSGSTNVLTGSGVDEAWMTGVLLAEGVVDLLRHRAPFTRANLERAYVARRRASWVDRESRLAAHARDGFDRGVLRGLAGMGLAALTRGRLAPRRTPRRPAERLRSLEAYFAGRIDARELEDIRQRCRRSGTPLHQALMDRVGWPPIRADGRLLVSHQDALLLGGKVQAPPGYADHVVIVDRALCRVCRAKLCADMCSGQALTLDEDGQPVFDRDKCVHCGACLWNCTQPRPGDSERSNIELRAGAGGLHSTEN